MSSDDDDESQPQQTPARKHSISVHELWTEQEVSEAFRIPVGTLRYWRTKRAVLPHRKIGALVRYDPREVQAAIDATKMDVVSPERDS